MSCEKGCSCDNQCKRPIKPDTHTKLPTKVVKCDPIVHRTRYHVIEQTTEYIIPEIYPEHTTHVNNKVYKHVISDPKTESHKEHCETECIDEKPHNHHRRKSGFDSWF